VHHYCVYFVCSKQQVLVRLQSPFYQHDLEPVRQHQLSLADPCRSSQQPCFGRRGAASLAELLHVGTRHRDQHQENVHRQPIIASSLIYIGLDAAVAWLMYQFFLVVAEVVTELSCRVTGFLSAVGDSAATSRSF